LADPTHEPDPTADPIAAADDAPDDAPEAPATPDVASEAPATPDVAPTDANLARRRFFREFAGELIHTAATVAGAAQAIQRASAEAAGAILDPVGTAARVESARPDARADDDTVTDPSTGPTGFRTPFREDDGVLLLIDQRKLPDQLVEVEVRNAP
jgi:hypothetical protein